MTRDATVEQSVRNSETMAQPYPPSWVDHFIDWVERLPGPYWLFYLALGLVAGFAQTLVQWREGSYPIGTLHPFHIWFAGQIAYLLALMHYLDKSAVCNPILNAACRQPVPLCAISVKRRVI